MSVYRRIKAYWSEPFNAAKEKRESMTGIITFIISALSFVARFAHLKVPLLDEAQSDTATLWIGIIVGIICALWAVVWLPIVVHEKETGKHDVERKVLCSEISGYKELLTPKLEFECNMGLDGCSSPAASVGRHYFKASVTNVCPQQSITECKAHLLKLEKNGLVIPILGARLIPFAPSHWSDSASKTLPPGIPIFVDVLVIGINVTPQAVLLPEIAGGVSQIVKNDGKPAFDSPGNYLLTIGVSGAGIKTKKARLQFEWTGKYQDSKITLIDQGTD